MSLPPLLGGGENPAGRTGLGRFLHRRRVRPLELLGAALGQPVPIAYGRHLVGGNVILQNRFKPGAAADKSISLFVALGDGEWEGPEIVWVNDRRLNPANTAKFHFHPGLDGESGDETSPSTRNQRICSFLPKGFRPRLNFARTAYAAFNIERDQKRPKKTREFEVSGIYRARRVRLFDDAGNQTAYAWSSNPAWCALDLLISRYLKPHGLVNEALTSAEMARIDFAAFKDWADFCDELIVVNGESVKRFECHVAFDQELDLMRALDLILLAGRAYLLERQGKLTPFPDKPRNSTFVIDADDFLPGSFQLARRPVRDTPNLYRFTYRDLDSGRGLGTISSSGTAVAGLDTEFTKFFERDGVIDLRSGAQKGEFRRVKEVVSDTQLKIASAFSADQSAGTAYGNPARDFEERVREAADESSQDQLGRVQEFEADLGGQMPERAERLAEYLRRSVTDRPRSLRLTLLSGVAGAIDLLPGDVVTAPGDLEFLVAREWEIAGITDNPDGSRSLEAVEYRSSVFVETAGPPPQPAEAPDLSGGFVDNAAQVANVLKNSSFFRAGVAGQEGTGNARFFKRYSNAGGSPTSADVEWVADRDVYVGKTSTSAVDKIGVRSLWGNLGRMFKPGQPVTVALALRHAGLDGLYDKDIKVKVDSDAETYVDADGAKLELTIPAESLTNQFQVFNKTFELDPNTPVPDALNVFIWSEAAGAAKSNHDYEIDWVTLAAGRIWVHFDPQATPYSLTWNAGTGLYDIDASAFIKDTAPGSDIGGAGEISGGAGSVEPDSGEIPPL